MNRIVPDEWLCVEGIQFDCTIGVTDRERSIKQTVVVNLRVHADFGDVKGSDAIRDTVDYREICRTVVAAGEKTCFQLIERLAGHLGGTLLAGFPAIRAVRVELWKPGALSAAKNVGVVVVEERRSAREGHAFGKLRHSTKMS
jgi:dihydroneopterin aldolase